MEQEESDFNSSDLYDVSLERLGLSVDTIKLLESVGFSSVGDCLDFLRRGDSASIIVPYGLIDTMYTEVVDRLRGHGYLKSDESFDSSV